MVGRAQCVCLGGIRLEAGGTASSPTVAPWVGLPLVFPTRSPTPTPVLLTLTRSCPGSHSNYKVPGTVDRVLGTLQPLPHSLTIHSAQHPSLESAVIILFHPSKLRPRL